MSRFLNITQFKRKPMIAGAIFSLSAVMVACGGGSSSSSNVTNDTATDNGDTDTVQEVTFDQVKANYILMAESAYADSLKTATDLQAAVDAFIAAPTEDNLAAAKAAYKDARVPYQQSEILRWDTAITSDVDLTIDGGPASVDEWEGQVNAWPLDENHIVSLIQGTEEINTDLLLAQNGEGGEANVTTGVHAVEFMLWGEDTHGTDAGAGERSASDFANDGSCVDTFCERRAQYLSVATDLLVADLTAMAAEWTATAATTQGTLAYNFSNNNLALDYIVGSMIAMATDELASARMGSGLTLGDPEEEHDCFSDLSHVAIFNNFIGVKNAFYGTYAEIDGASLGDLIAQRDQALFDEIEAAFVSIEANMQIILDAGERTENTIRFDQIIGQDSSALERAAAEAAIEELISLDTHFHNVQELLSLVEINTDGGGDGD